MHSELEKESQTTFEELDKTIDFIRNKEIPLFYEEAANTLFIDTVDKQQLTDLVPTLNNLIASDKLSKILVKTSEAHALHFFRLGFVIEASIPVYFELQDALFMAYYSDVHRREITDLDVLEEIVNQAFSSVHVPPGKVFEAHNCKEKQGEQLHRLVSQLSQPGAHAIDTDIECEDYFYVTHEGRWVALVNIHRDTEFPNIQINEIFISPEVDRSQVWDALLASVEQQQTSPCVLYALVRANTLADNQAFALRGYDFTGRLSNNQYIEGQLHSMNVWSKHLA